MRYRIEQCQNPQVVIIHHTFRLPSVSPYSFLSHEDQPDDEDRLLAKNLESIDGVKEIWISDYQVQIEKALLFEWEPILKEAVEVLRQRLTPKSAAVEIK